MTKEHPVRSLFRRNRPRLALFIVVVLATVGLFYRSETYPDLLKPTCAVRHDQPDRGDCQALGGPRRPSWACFSTMRSEFPTFLKIYARRPFPENRGGMRMDHSFALFYILRQLRPRIVIESGAFRGHSTWLIRQALPWARIISMDPRRPARRIRGVKYLVGKDFVDFGQVDWEKMGVDKERTLVFMDDHHGVFPRAFDQNSFGFRHFVFEDNYPYPIGDNESPKHVCETARPELWPGSVPYDFGKQRRNMTWDEHLERGGKFNMAVEHYYEFPPIAPHGSVNYTSTDAEYTSTPIFQDISEVQRIIGNEPISELKGYCNIAYIELRAEHAGPL